MEDRGAEPQTAAPEDELASRQIPPEGPALSLHPLAVAVVVTLGVTVISYAAPLDYAATAVGAAFVGAVIWLVLRFDAATVRHFGLSLGGLLEPGPLEPRRLLAESARAAAWTLGLVLVIFAPFAVGFRIYWHVRQGFHFRPPASFADELLGQVLVIALPEEAFYRGYLTTALDDAWGTPLTLAKAKVGWGLVATSALFAVGHVLTEPNPQRLAVFFPALLFGWLRARTGGVGVPILFHALCNVLASTLTRGYGMGG
jgi:membrane protease YdiL (CAAX protease family)